MTLGERIKACRQNAKLSQEQIAGAVGVSRQAVTKWEADQSAPSTENLFKLAEILGTTVDMLLNSDKETTQSTAEQVHAFYQMEQEKKSLQHRTKVRKNILTAFIVAASYLIIYLTGRFIWCSLSDNSLIGWLFFTRPSGENSYLYGWLLSSNLFWFATAISTIPAFFGKYKFSFTTLAVFLIGLLLGTFFGPYPTGSAYGHNHYGWAIWLWIYFASIIVGILLKHFLKSGFLFRSKTKKVKIS